jgi:hypothetical protein
VGHEVGAGVIPGVGPGLSGGVGPPVMPGVGPRQGLELRFVDLEDLELPGKPNGEKENEEGNSGM